jgi:hypothetical protein
MSKLAQQIESTCHCGACARVISLAWPLVWAPLQGTRCTKEQDFDPLCTHLSPYWRRYVHRHQQEGAQHCQEIVRDAQILATLPERGVEEPANPVVGLVIVRRVRDIHKPPVEPQAWR